MPDDEIETSFDVQMLAMRAALKADRRKAPSLMRRLFGWIMRERRSGFDRRGRVDNECKN